ncbi:kinesin-like protein KIF6 [Haliotis asinina]|uniref:kinesin-like protein KIF6 n=1 Tax=Haliotis asinina TaxID=109174 RepID=UPI0035324CBE
MVKQTIQIFGRIKPTKAKTGRYEVDQDDEGCPRLTVTVPKELAEGFINNKREHYKFRFERVFDQKTTQDEVFEHVAKPVIDNVLQGYNGTIFAYGQTGSGKTFTITGGAERYIDRGIIPRTLSYIFDKIEKSPELSFTVHVSYLEIYNESGFDLLDPKHEATKLEDLPKVSLMEDSDQNIHLKNLSVHQAASEEDALNLLFLGDTNRMIAETPMNQASTRSHCIFTIHLTAREAGSATIRRAKLHLVDLAGSERVSKTGVNGVLLTEAKYINLSLHFLEQVIISLSEKGRVHIPYRNSMMTSVLRDSLGGNCMTTMIATCSVDKKNIDETISTCRFAQRVAMIKNDVMLNEELDPKLMIQKLKREIQQLKEELALATGQQRTDQLTEEELQRCEEAVNAYLEDTDPDSIISVGADMRKIHTCFNLLKKLVLERPATSPVRETTPVDTGPYNNAETQKLKDLVMQRDNEINILVNMLKKEKKRAADAISLSESHRGSNLAATRGNRMTNGDDSQNGYHSHNYSSHSATDNRYREGEGHRETRSSGKASARAEMAERTKTKILGRMSMGRQEAFDIFMRDYEHNQKIEENKKILKQRYAEAKVYGENLNKAKTRINLSKSKIEQHRMQLAMQGLADPDNPDPDEVEQSLRDQMESDKAEYKQTFTHLRTMKTEIEHLQHLLEKAKVKLMKDFELWWAEQSANAQDQSIPQSVRGSVKSAWRTPPLTPLQHNQRNYTQEVISPVHSETSLPRPPSSSRERRTVAANISASNFPPAHGEESSGYTSQGSVSSSHGHKSKSAHHINNIPLTGDSQADADIMAFIKARQNLVQKVNQGNR